MERLTIIGVENTLNITGKSIVDFVSIDNDKFSKETFLDTLILKYGELEVLFASPPFFYTACKAWANKWNETFSRLWNVFEDEYNPLWNYDKTSTVSDTRTITGTENFKKTNNITADTTYTGDTKVADNSTYTTTDNQTTEGLSTEYGDVSSMDYHGTATNPPTTEGERKYIPQTRRITDNSNVKYTTQTTNSSDRTETTTYNNGNNTITSSNGTDEGTRQSDETYTHKETTTGNIGVMSTQDLLNQEKELRLKDNLYNKMAIAFKDELLVAVY